MLICKSYVVLVLCKHISCCAAWQKMAGKWMRKGDTRKDGTRSSVEEDFALME